MSAPTAAERFDSLLRAYRGSDAGAKLRAYLDVPECAGMPLDDAMDVWWAVLDGHNKVVWGATEAIARWAVSYELGEPGDGTPEPEWYSSAVHDRIVARRLGVVAVAADPYDGDGPVLQILDPAKEIVLDGGAR